MIHDRWPLCAPVFPLQKWQLRSTLLQCNVEIRLHMCPLQKCHHSRSGTTSSTASQIQPFDYPRCSCRGIFRVRQVREQDDVSRLADVVALVADHQHFV